MRCGWLTGILGAAVVLLLGGAGVAQSSGRRPAADTGANLAKQSCAACHGPTGNSPDPQFPKLAGQNPAYLYRQLWAFKTGQRPSEVMRPIAAPLSDAQMLAVAGFFSRQVTRPDVVHASRRIAQGRDIFFRGAGRLAMTAPACVQCHVGPGGYRRPMMGMGMGMGHGMMGMGMMGGMADVPQLAGQHAGYTVGQLKKFAGGQRPSAVMGRIAAGLTPAERQAVADYLATLR